MSPKVLEINDITKTFGGVTAVSKVSFDVRQGEMVGLIGPNGAGKTTLLKMIIGAVGQTSGQIMLDGNSISSMKTAQRCNLGLAMSHQIVRPFRNMSILDNVTLAAGKAITRSPLLSLVRVNRDRQRARAMEVLDVVQIGALAHQSPGHQPLGVLKRLEVARALVMEPRILLLDEPLAGLGHGETAPIAQLLQRVSASGVTILLVEHNLVEARRLCPRFVVLDNGHKIADGPTEEVMQDQNVIAAYIGKETRDA